MSKIIYCIGLIFVYFAYLQINDSDSIVWVIIYLIPAILPIFLILNLNMFYFKYISSCYFIYAIYLTFNNVDSQVMHIFSETTNEILGLLFCSIWIFILSIIKIDS